jgi:hypothetical protein
MLIYGFYFIHNKNKKLNNSCRYTIGVPYIYQVNSETSNSLRYYYYVGNKRYEGEALGSIDKCNRCLLYKRFYVKYYPEDPKISELLLDYSVPDSIREALKHGGDSIR